MMFPDWWTNRLKTDFTRKQILMRVVDLFLSNLGLFLGILTTVMIYIFSWNVTPQVFFHEMFFEVWLANIPALTFCCLFAYAVNGFYGGIWNTPYLSQFLAVSKGVAMAFCLFLLLIYMTRPLMPRTTMIMGWIFIFVLILSARLFWTAFSRRYRFVSIAVEVVRDEKLMRELAVIAQQDDWIPPEGLPAKAAWPYFEDDEILAIAYAILRRLKRGVSPFAGDRSHFYDQLRQRGFSVRQTVLICWVIQAVLAGMGVWVYFS